MPHPFSFPEGTLIINNIFENLLDKKLCKLNKKTKKKKCCAY